LLFTSKGQIHHPVLIRNQQVLLHRVMCPAEVTSRWTILLPLKGQIHHPEFPWTGPTLSLEVDQTYLPYFRLLLKTDVVEFVDKELIRIKKTLDPSECLLDQREDEDEDEEDESMRICRKAFQDIMLQFLRRRQQDHLADILLNRTLPTERQNKLKSLLKRRFERVVEGDARGKNSSLDQIYTDLFHTEGGTGDVISEHEVRQIESASRKQNKHETKIGCENLFKPNPGRQEPIRSVMTKGIAGIGKTVFTQKLALDWAKGKVNQDIQFMFPIAFRELNLLKDKKYSLMELLKLLFPGTIEKMISGLEEFRVLFIFDGLDEF
ncbi:hypothetical protein D4764_10G0007700, partial [Takifugu flavidus]